MLAQVFSPYVKIIAVISLISLRELPFLSAVQESIVGLSFMHVAFFISFAGLLLSSPKGIKP